MDAPLAHDAAFEHDGESDAGHDSGVSDGSDHADSPVDGAVATGFPFPPVTYQGGPLIEAPKVITITFSGDTMATELSQFGSGIGSGQYWDAIRDGYCGGGTCVGDGPPGQAVALTSTASSSYSDSGIESLLTSLIAANTVPPPDSNTIYVLYFPPTSVVSHAGGMSCQDFYGYHGRLTSGAQQVAYAVIPECPAFMTTPPITNLQSITLAASHELVEAATDSGPTHGFFLDLTNPSTWGWADTLSGEIADLCVDQFGTGQDEAMSAGFMVQRIWSTLQAKSGRNPCTPIPTGETYFNTYATTSVLVLGVGQTGTIQVNALADGPMVPWTVSLQDWTDPNMPYLSFGIGGQMAASVASGDTLQVQVTLLADPAATANRRADAVIVSANGSATTATIAHMWPFVVVTPAEAADAGL